MKTIAAIDIGTNSMRFMLCRLYGNTIAKKEKELIVTRIGKDLSKTGIISQKSFIRNIDALKYFKNKADRYGAEEIFAIATSAVRDASNGNDFVSDALIQAGLNVRVISGEEEAELGLKGVMSGVQNPEENILVIDIGGGSTELIFAREGRIDYSVSIPMGAVRMTEQYVTSNTINDENILNMKNKLDELFKESLEYLNKKRIERIIAIGGTATTTAAMFHGLSIYDPEIVHNTVINLSYADSIFNKLKDMSLHERRYIKGMQKERADVIPAGIYILKYIIEGLKKDSFTVSENDNLEGIIEKYIFGKVN